MAAPWEMDWQGDDSAGGVDTLIQQASAKYDIPEDRLRAVIGAESNFDPNAVSSAGAQGLMQLMPATAKDMGVTDSFDPAQNIEGGARYLAQLKNQFGDWDTAHAAYNFGPGNVAKGKPLPEETKAYLQKINAQVGEKQDDQPAPWDMPWSQDAKASQPAEGRAPWEMAWADEKPEIGQPEPIEKTVGDLAAMPVAERAGRLIGGAIPGAAETAVQMLAQVPQMGTQVLGMVKALADGKTTKADFDQATQDMTPQWISDLATAKVLQPETYAGKLLSHGLGQLFELAGEAPAAVGAGLKASIEAIANGEGTEGARKRFTDEYAKLSPVTSQLFNAALVGEGVHQVVKGVRGTPAEAQPVEAPVGTDQSTQAPADVAPEPPAAPTVDPMQEAVQRAVDLTNETGVQHRARQVDGSWTAVPDQGAAPPTEILNAESVDDAIAAAQRATEVPMEPARAETPPEPLAAEQPVPVEAPQEAPAAVPEAPQVAPEPVVAPEVAAPAEAPAERGVADMSPHEIDLALRLTRSEERRAELQSELERRQPETPNVDQIPETGKDVARNNPQPGAAVDARGHDELAPAPSAEGGPGAVDAARPGPDQLAHEVVPRADAAQGLAPAEQRLADAEQAPSAAAPDVVAPRLQDFTTSKGEVKTFKTAELAEKFRFANARALRGYTAREAEPGEWRFSRTERVRTEAQKANDQVLARRARTVQPHDDLATLLRKSGGVNVAELTRDGADAKSIADSMRFGAARKTGGMSLDAAAEVMGQHGYDVFDSSGAVDATKARELIQNVLDGERVYTPEGHEIRAAIEQRNREEGFHPDEEILRQSNLEPHDALDAGMVARAAEIDEGRVERLAIQYEDDDAGFARAIREFLDEPNHEIAARSETAPAAQAPADTAEALARLKRAIEASRAAKPGEMGPVTAEFEAASRAAKAAGATPMQIVQAMEAPRRPLGPEERLRVLEGGLPKESPPPAPRLEPAKETPAPAGVSASEAAKPRIEDAPPALLRRVTVAIERFHEGEGVKTEQVAAHEAMAEHDAEISAFEKLLECVRG